MNWLTGWYICVDPEARQQDRYAALELQSYLRKITGELTKIVEVAEMREPHLFSPIRRCIYVGPSRLLSHNHPPVSRMELEDEEILIWRKGDAIALTGGGKRGVVYAVYAFLEKFIGCRFFAEDVEDVPDRLPDLPENILFRDRPAFEFRDNLFLWQTSGSWAAKVRLNGHFANVTPLQGFKRNIFPFVHTFDKLVPPERYFRTHPEYFSLIQGDRNPLQLCLSNPKVQEIAVRQVLRWIRENPEYKIFSVSENDGGGFCECDACWKMNGKEAREALGKHSQPGSFFRFVNLIADEVAARYPGRFIDTLSYSYLNLYPPRHFSLSPNVIVRMCANVDVTNRLNQWLSAARKVYIWHYFAQHHYLLPFPLVLHAIPTVARGYRDKGVKGLFLQTRESEHGGIETTKLQTYISSKLLWNPDEDPRGHAEEFIRHYYGPAGPWMQEFFDLQDRLFRKMNIRFDPWAWVLHTLEPLRPLMPELERRSRPLFVSARARTRATPFASRVEEAAVPFRYFRIFSRDIPARICRDRIYPQDLSGYERDFRALVKTMKENRMTYFAHNCPLAEMEDALKPLPLLRLENETLEVLVLPDCGGRIVQVRFGPDRRDLIPIPCNGLNFENVGYEEYTGHIYHNPGYREPYHVDSHEVRGNPSLVLSASLSDGFAVRRTYRLEGNKLLVETILRNTTRGRLTAGLRVHPVWKCDPDRDRVEIPSLSGKSETGSIRSFHNRMIPAPDSGTWRFCLESTGVTIENVFSPENTERVFLWTGEGCFTSELFSREIRMSPSGRFRHVHRYRFLPLERRRGVRRGSTLNS